MSLADVYRTIGGKVCVDQVLDTENFCGIFKTFLPLNYTGSPPAN